MFSMKLVAVAFFLMAAVRASEEEDLLGVPEEKDASREVFKRATPPADYRYNNGYYNGVYDYYNNPLGYKPGYYNPANYNSGYYNPGYYNTNRYYNRRSYPNNYEGSPYGPYNPGYYSGYYNSTRYPYGNYNGYRANYPNPYLNYPGYQGYNPYNPAYNPAYDRFNDQGYYQGRYYNNPSVYNRANDAEKNKNQ
ncbi:eukaryotic peptide chain release factor GTP-binding subunit-like isoform X2 [Cryptotermes secundus]|uniref:eukaryotic peptide chain release factor GTP-binding subunit-like isoform X2 n=1 Tax=Cryptotermes secundus TaxID=105785 RepID=UPI000CD7D127|nr:eukaryotic peptide chain release factor GTP-binding subunit-like isoform X2 [Cryptotermes secundus]